MQYMNREAIAYTGVDDDMTHTPDWVSLIHADDVDQARRRWRAAIETGAPLYLDCRIRRFDGTYRWHALRAVATHTVSGGPPRWVATATDIDDAKVLEAVLRRSERQAARRWPAGDAPGQGAGRVRVRRPRLPPGPGQRDVAGFNGRRSRSRSGDCRETSSRTSGLGWNRVPQGPRRENRSSTSRSAVRLGRPTTERHWLNSYTRCARTTRSSASASSPSRSPSSAEPSWKTASWRRSWRRGVAILGATSDGVVTTWNRAAEGLFGYSAKEMIGRPLDDRPRGSLLEQRADASPPAGGRASDIRHETHARGRQPGRGAAHPSSATDAAGCRRSVRDRGGHHRAGRQARVEARPRETGRGAADRPGGKLRTRMAATMLVRAVLPRPGSTRG